MDTIAIVIIVISVVFVLLFPIYQPFGMVLANMIASGCFFIYKKLHYSQYETVDKRTFWRGPLRIYARMWNFFGRVYHGYEMVGIEKIPKQGPALLIIYHGYLPLDGFFILSKILLDLDRKVVTIVEKLNDKIPCYKTFTEAVEHSPGTIDWCVETLQNGDLLAIYPGGTREAFLTDTYEIIWRDNAGFAKVALQTNATIIPIFTQNVRDFMLVFKVFTNYFKKLYLKYRIGFRLFYGWWPIKMKSIVGDPVQYEPTDSVEEVVRKTKEAMQKLINENQRVPNNLFRSLLDRF